MEKRILLKISGESLMGSSNYGIDVSTINQISNEIKNVYKKKYQICLIIGGGNIFRGIKGASEGIGLGLRFLKHIERTGVFIFLLTRDYGEGRGLLEDFLTLRNELKKFDESLLERPFLIAVSQCDRADVQDILAESLESLSQYGSVYPFSSFSKTGLKDLMTAISKLLMTSNRWSVEDMSW